MKRLPLLVLMTMLALATAMRAERLPLRVFSTVDGLANDTVYQIYSDSHGFLWFCTGEGLSRFDGSRFRNFTQEDGLPHRNILDILEIDDGRYLIATTGGLVEYDPLGTPFRWNILRGGLERDSDAPPLFSTFLPPEAVADPQKPKAVVTLARGGDGNIYAGGTFGLYRLARTGSTWSFEHVALPGIPEGTTSTVNEIRRDAAGGLWIAAARAILLMSPSGETRVIDEKGGNSVFEDKKGRVWVDSGGNDLGLRRYEYRDGSPFQTGLYTKADGFWRNTFTNVVADTFDGRLLVSSDQKGYVFDPDAPPGPRRLRALDDEFHTGAVDSSGNVWLGMTSGAARFSPNSFELVGRDEATRDEVVTSITGSAVGEVFVTSGISAVTRIVGGRVETVVPAGARGHSEYDNHIFERTSDGSVWIPDKSGLRRYRVGGDFAALGRTAPAEVFDRSRGLPDDGVVLAFADSHDGVWLTSADQAGTLCRVEASTSAVRCFAKSEGLPVGAGAIAYGEDPAGNVWLGFFNGQILRYRGGRFESMNEEGKLPMTFVSSFRTDRLGRFWISTLSRGVFEVRDPGGDKPDFRSYSMREGLSSNQTTCVTDDNLGRIYVGTGRGVNRIDPSTGRVKVFSVADGLPSNAISKCYTDAVGTLWLSAAKTLFRYTPSTETVPTPPPVMIDALIANGRPVPVADLVAASRGPIEFPSEVTRLRVSFFGISLAPGATLRYQYRLNDQDWSEPREDRFVEFNLAAGTYRFEVRAVNADNVFSSEVAAVNFEIRRPVWQRWWFLLIVSAVLTGLIFFIYRRRTENLRRINAALTEARDAEERLGRAREERIAELQKVRTRIANDLHDDIGSSLTQIALFSEVARQRGAGEGAAAGTGEALDQITSVANDLVDTMSDIVWAINPRKDHLSDLTQRMRRFASDVLTAAGIDLEFDAPTSDRDVPLGANIRREVFLIFKETVNNIARHSGASSARIRFSIGDGRLEIEFADDGSGFDATEEGASAGESDWKKFRSGNGLINMRRRAADLGGRYEIESSPDGGGTRSLLVVELDAGERPAESYPNG